MNELPLCTILGPLVSPPTYFTGMQFPGADAINLVRDITFNDTFEEMRLVCASKFLPGGKGAMRVPSAALCSLGDALPLEWRLLGRTRIAPIIRMGWNLVRFDDESRSRSLAPSPLGAAFLLPLSGFGLYSALAALCIKSHYFLAHQDYWKLSAALLVVICSFAFSRSSLLVSCASRLHSALELLFWTRLQVLAVSWLCPQPRRVALYGGSP